MIEESHRHSNHVELEYENLNDNYTILVATSRSVMSQHGVFGRVFENYKNNNY